VERISDTTLGSREEWKATLVELVKEGDYLRTVVEER
jgi:hypothetical protein